MNSTRSPTLTWKAARLPVSNGLPSPMARILPCFGFSLAVSGRMIPPAVLASASKRSTTILSFSGISFIIVSIESRAVTIPDLEPRAWNSELSFSRLGPVYGAARFC